MLPKSVVAREFARLFASHQIATHPAEVRHLATRFLAAGHDRIDDVEGYFLAYADPTGERATRELDRENAATLIRTRAAARAGA